VENGENKCTLTPAGEVFGQHLSVKVSLEQLLLSLKDQLSCRFMVVSVACDGESGMQVLLLQTALRLCIQRLC